MAQTVSPYIMNPAFYADEDVREAVADAITANPFGASLTELASAFPDDYGCALPEDGAWIMVKEQPHTIIPDPPLYSMWWAKPIWTTRSFVLRVPRKKRIAWPCLKARILTADGELDLWPGEYVTVKDITKWIELLGEGVDVNWLGDGEPGDMADKLFYLQSHGLPRGAALSMLIPELTPEAGVSPDFLYLTLNLEEAT